jgi:hypothetical protein
MELTKDTIIAQFNTVIGEIARAQLRSTRSIAKALTMCVYASIELQDAGMANGLIKCLRKSTKQNAIKDFMEYYGNLCVPKSGDIVYFDAKREWTAEYKAEVMKAAQNWESFKVEADPTILDVEAKLESILKQGATAVKNNREVKHAELLLKINALLAEFHANAFDAE